MHVISLDWINGRILIVQKSLKHFCSCLLVDAWSYFHTQRKKGAGIQIYLFNVKNRLAMLQWEKTNLEKVLKIRQRLFHMNTANKIKNNGSWFYLDKQGGSLSKRALIFCWNSSFIRLVYIDNPTWDGGFVSESWDNFKKYVSDVKSNTFTGFWTFEWISSANITPTSFINLIQKKQNYLSRLIT